ncbi:MAG: LacI family DNA-binding transcriptional regulator [Lentisphaeria bacterium]|nr:LacI family DNA-binding transcriptional regulator [Lentisphaeria bacterium]
MPSNYPTLKDVSAEAGVSMALASVVLSGKKSRIKASAETRERILKAAEKFGYEPNRNARALRMNSSFLIGVLAYDISSSFIPQILSGIEKGFIHTNYSVLPMSFNTQEEFAECLETFRRRKVDGLIIITTSFQEFPEGLAMWNRIGKVFIGCHPHLDYTSSVSADAFAVGALAAKTFLKRKCKKFMYLTYSASNNINGWKKTLDDAGIPPGDRFTVYTKLDLELNLKIISDTLTAHPEIDCIFADSDIMAATVLRAAEQLGRKIPDDLQVIGVDDSIICQITSPKLTSIWQPKIEQGEAAAAAMLKLLKTNTGESLVLPIRLNDGKSIKPLEDI